MPDINIVKKCPLCAGEALEWALDRAKKAYFRCKNCGTVFLGQESWPEAGAERERYLLHRNGEGDHAYLAYMEDIATRGLLPFISAGAEILDYGSGPFPALAHVLGQRGYRVVSWDPLFSPEASLLARPYPAIACIEVAEHFREAQASFAAMASLLLPGGILCLRSLIPPDDPASFLAWWYRMDPTHLAFYPEEAYRHIESKFGLSPLYHDGKGLRTWKKLERSRPMSLTQRHREIEE